MAKAKALLRRWAAPNDGGLTGVWAATRAFLGEQP